MSVHVLDTGAVLRLHDKHSPPLLRELRALGGGDAVWIPAMVLLEASQARALQAKRLERILAVADVYEHMPQRVVDRAAEGLRAVSRVRCSSCGALSPSLVDAIVMALADEYADNDQVTVHTGDIDDLSQLREAAFPRVTIRGLA